MPVSQFTDSHPRRVRISNAWFGTLLSGAALVLTLGGTMATALAGDLLRGGYTGTPGKGGTPGSFSPPSVSKARANARDALAHATQAVDAVQAMENNARLLAASAGKNNLGVNPNNPSLQLPNVPNGLGIGGLNPAAGATSESTLWSGAKLPTQTTTDGQTTVTVDQTSAEAVLTWQSFNVGRKTTLDFDQSAGGSNVGNWIAFNEIMDPSDVPAQILGSIHAPGQVYVIDQNGIIFGANAQVNTHALVASSLPINNYLVGVGLVNNPDDQFLFSQIAIPALPTNPIAPAFTPPAAPAGGDGDVIVQAGAVLESPANADNVGGKVALVGPNVSNAGTILTPDGQTILAAGEQVGFLPHPSSDPSLRGLDAYVGQDGGTAVNTGSILAPEAVVTMIGGTVKQLGEIMSTTSVSLNGEINLDADSGTEVAQSNGQNNLATTSAGNVTFGPNSITEILPEVNSSATITSAQPPPNQALALASEVNVQGETIHLAGDAELLAPDATVDMEAGQWLPTGGAGLYGFEYTKGQIYLDSGALIDVAGSEDVGASVTQNIVAVQLLGPELADSPLQRGSVLRGQTIHVDIRDQGVYDGTPWIGTPLADAYGYAGLVPYTVGELTTNGGAVSLQAGGSVVMQKGSEVNVSSGWIDYSGGVVTTSELISGGNIYPIDEATPDIVYNGFLPQFSVVNPKWGVSATYKDPLITGSHYEDGYVYGGAGGAVTITAPSTALDGTLLGLTVNGPHQVGPNSLQATPSSVTIAFEAQNPNLPASNYPVYAATPPAVVFSTQDNMPPAAPFSVDASGDPAALSVDRTEKVILSPDLFTTDGFGNLTVRDGDGSVTVPAGVMLDAGADGSVTLDAANMNIAGSILAPGGSIDLTVYDYTPYTYANELTATPPPDPTRGRFVLASGATLDVAGLVIDDRDGAPDAGGSPEITAGGVVSIDSYSVNLEAGSVINASGGVEDNAAGKPTYGAGGSISILAGADPILGALTGGKLELDGELMAFSGVRGGSLDIQAQNIQIGGNGATGDTLVLPPGFFDEGGFGSFGLEAIKDFNIAPGTDISPEVLSLVALQYAPGGAGLETATALLPVESRTPVSLAFSAEGVTDNLSGITLFNGDFVMGKGSQITTDPLGNISITADAGTISIFGSIDAPGGKIAISAGNTVSGYLNGSPTQALPTVYLSPQTTISTAGTTIYTPNAYGYVTGLVIGGGSISIGGDIVAEAGSVLDVSGASATLDETPAYTNIELGLNGANDAAVQTALNGSFHGALLTPQLIESNAGSITLSGKDELFTDATLIGQAGGSQALGGTLTISSSILNPTPGITLPPTQITLVITQNGRTIAGSTLPAGDSDIGKVVVGTNTTDGLQTDGGHIAVESFAGGGFDSVNLNGTVDFDGAVRIEAGKSISVGTNGILYGNGKISLTAPFVTLGQAFLPPINPALVAPFAAGSALPPEYGTGTLTVTAQLIDVGNLSLDGIGGLNLIADGGDIQGDGTLDVAGNIHLTAAQIFPATETTFEIVAYNYTDSHGNAENGSVTIRGSGTQALPLSAGGTLDIYASDIIQDGVLRAPFGTINLGWDGSGVSPEDPVTGAGITSGYNVPVTETVSLGAGSVTSVSAIDPLTGQGVTIPYGLILNGISWIDPSGTDITVSGAPQKAINISGVDVKEQRGATIDIRGGGDLFAYQFVPGVNGNIDILGSASSAWAKGTDYSAGQLVSYNGATYYAVANSRNVAPSPGAYWELLPQAYAIIPGYSPTFAPYAPFYQGGGAGGTSSVEATNLQGDPGYVNSSLVPGDAIYLPGGDGLTAGTYTLLPARYATLPGAYLVSPLQGTPGIAGLQPDGAYVSKGYTIGNGQALVGNFEVESPSVIAQEAEYDQFTGTAFLGANSNARTPADSGQLVLEATQGMTLEGVVLSRPLDSNAQGGLVEIDSPVNITIAAPGAAASGNGLVLDAGQLSAIGAQTLLIGGYTSGADGTAITVESNNVTVDTGAALSGGDIILVANDDLSVDKGATIKAEGSSDSLDFTLAGNGALLRVSDDAAAGIVRTGLSSSGNPATLSVGAGVKLKGASIILDSSQVSTLDPTASLDAKAVTIDSGLISIVEPGFSGGQGLILSGNALQQIQTHASALTLLSYSSIDIYGTGTIGAAAVLSLTLSAAEIAGYDQSGGTTTLSGKAITLEGAAGGTAPILSGAGSGTLAFDGGVIHLGPGALAINQFANVQLNATGGILGVGAGELSTAGGLAITTPLITGAAGSDLAISAGKGVTIANTTSSATISGGLAANISITGESIEDNSNILLPGGRITLNATGGGVDIGTSASAELGVNGIATKIFDLPEYTSGGTITLTAIGGNITVGSQGKIDVSAAGGGGNAGTVAVSDAGGSFVNNGTLLAQAGVDGKGGSFSLDENALATLSALAPALDTAGFTQSIQIEVATGDLTADGDTTASDINLSADQGSITVSGVLDAAGQTGGTITLTAAQNVTLNLGADLDASGNVFNDAGKGGAVTLSAGADVDGQASTTAEVDVATGSTIKLGVGANTSNSANAGDFTGTLLIRAPQTVAGTDVQVAPIAGTVTGASSIVVEGYRIYNAATDPNLSGGQITAALEAEIYNNGVAFLGPNGQTTAAYTTMLERLEGSSGLAMNIETGVEIINLSGNLTLGTPTGNTSGDWNLANDRFGPNGTAGQLVLRASGNLIFDNSLSDGFQGSTNTAPLLAQNTALPVNIQSWSYTLTAGANMSAADPGAVFAGAGSVELGRNDPIPYANGTGTGPTAPGGKTQTSTILYPNGGQEDFYQVIRTGAGNIQISAGGNVELLNQFASIYTAGTQLTTSETDMGGTFQPPAITLSTANQGASVLGSLPVGSIYPAQYSEAGGNIDILAQGDIEHLTQDSSGNLVEDSSLEMPNNWLYRRGYYGLLNTSKYGDIATTTWWVDFSNFFEGVGALGGGNVTLDAGQNVANVDAVVPTNARMPEGTPSASALDELGGGDVTVTAGNDINAGVYYVERGEGTLTAGNSIITNSTRAGTLAELLSPGPVVDSPDAAGNPVADTWLPTTLFLGQGNFSVTAGENVLLGPVANVFLMPQGVGNTFWYKTYFSTYGESDAVNVTSLAGDITLRQDTMNDLASGQGLPLLEEWMNNVDTIQLSLDGGTTVSYYQPWLRLAETDASDFQTEISLLPPVLQATSLSGDIDIEGNLTLSPAPAGTLELVAEGSINAEQPEGYYNSETAWNNGTIIISDASPGAIPGVSDPLAYESLVGKSVSAESSARDPFTEVDALFAENGATNQTLQEKQELHGSITNSSGQNEPLHTGDTTPVYLYAGHGDISGLTLYSPTETRVIAGEDITDISLYLQNISSSQISVVSAGNDIVAYDPDSPLRNEAQTNGNVDGAAIDEGDIQISGPGTLEVLAGSNLDLGVGPNGSNPGIGVGITSIGNQRNPYLPSSGADVIAMAGTGALPDLTSGDLGFEAFVDQFVTGPDSATYLSELSSIATGLPSFSTAAEFKNLPKDEQDIIALDVFFLVLRDAGRDHNIIGSPGYGNYSAGYEAIADLFPRPASGDISLTSREIATENGGNVSILDPSGGLTVGVDIQGNQPLDQGIFTEDGGNISIFTRSSILVGTSRIFTLRGGNEILWSTGGNIAAGESAKTVQEAPPTQVIVDPTSANVQTDLGGLATGGGIGVLASVQGVPAGNVDLIAPVGTVDAGDAGIRVTGNLNIAAAQVLNVGNIQVGGASSGVPTTVIIAPNIAALSSASSAAGAGAAAAASQINSQTQSAADNGAESVFVVQVIGYGGGEDD